MPSTCKGDVNKALIAQYYNLTCIAHLWTFERKEKLCWCGKPLEYEAYLFVRWSKAAPGYAKTFPVGTGCAIKMAKVANIRLPPKCTIFVQAARRSKTTHPVWNCLNLELYRGIQCLCSLADYFPTPQSILGRILIYLTRNLERQTQDFAVCEFNRLIPKILIGSTSLRAAYSAIMSESDLKRPEMCFPEMANVVKQSGQKSYL